MRAGVLVPKQPWEESLHQTDTAYPFWIGMERNLYCMQINEP